MSGFIDREKLTATEGRTWSVSYILFRAGRPRQRYRNRCRIRVVMRSECSMFGFVLRETLTTREGRTLSELLCATHCSKIDLTRHVHTFGVRMSEMDVSDLTCSQQAATGRCPGLPPS